MIYVQGSIEEHAILGNPDTYFDRPIAVLTGPNAVSGGDIFALKMTFHPMARTFGKSTCGAFSSMYNHFNFLGHSDWYLTHTLRNYFLVSNPGNYLARTESHVDEEIWFTHDDVANGEDTVVKAALAWINSMIYAYNVKMNSTFVRPTIDTLNITARVKNPPNHNLDVATIINTIYGVFVDSIPMFDDGNHGDSLAGDGIYGCYSNTFTEENIFSIDASVTDLDSNHYHKLTNASRFTTVGPVVVNHYEIPQISSSSFQLKIFLKNEGLTATATDISINISSNDTNITTITPNTLLFGNITPGQIDPSNGVYYVSTQTNPLGMSIDFTVDISSDGWEFWSDSFSVVVSGILAENKNIPKEYRLSQNYPNPFNPSTTIEFDLPKTSEVGLKIFNILGEEVAMLVSDRLSAGSYSYEWDASNLASGVYLYRLQAGDYVETRKMVLMR
jgi:hypothetical protein